MSYFMDFETADQVVDDDAVMELEGDMKLGQSLSRPRTAICCPCGSTLADSFFSLYLLSWLQFVTQSRSCTCLVWSWTTATSSSGEGSSSATLTPTALAAVASPSPCDGATTNGDPVEEALLDRKNFAEQSALFCLL